MPALQWPLNTATAFKSHQGRCQRIQTAGYRSYRILAWPNPLWIAEMFMNVNHKDLQHLLHPTTRVSLLPQVSRQMHPAPRVDSQAKRWFQRDGTMGQQKNHGHFDFEISKESCGKKTKKQFINFKSFKSRMLLSSNLNQFPTKGNLLILTFQLLTG